MYRKTLVDWVRRIDKQWQRRLWPGRRRVLVNARTAMNYATISPIVDRLKQDPRIELYFTASENPKDAKAIYAEVHRPFKITHPKVAALTRFDAYLAADFLWVKLPRGARRVQTFHGVAGKYRRIYDSPAQSMRGWDRLYFINQRRLDHFLEAGAIDANSSAARLIGMPKLDCLVDGSLKRDQILTSLGIDPARRTVLYAPTWSPYSSLTTMGEELIKQLGAAGYAVIAKLHDRSREPSYINSGGVDWGTRLEPLLKSTGGVLAKGANSSRYLPGADLLITDHSSVGFEFLLLDRPVIRIELPQLIEKTDVEPIYVDLLSQVSTSVTTVEDAISAVDRSFLEPRAKSEVRKAVAKEMFYQAGSATDRAVSDIYEVLELQPLHAV